MKCKGIIKEQNKEKECWLPANPSSSLQLCRRCHFLKITAILDTLTHEYWNGELHPENEIVLNDPDFLFELLHPAREQAFLNLLSAVYKQNKIQFERIVEKAKQKTVFPIFITKRIQAHSPGPRCQMYRDFMKDSDIYKAPNHCWNCWSCIVWSLKQNNTYLMELFSKNYLFHLQRLTSDIYRNNGPRVFLDFMVTTHLLQKDHVLRIFIDHCFHVLPLEDIKSLLLQFFQEPCMLSVFFRNLQNDYLPLPLRDAVVVNEFRQRVKQSIKEKTDLFKEELVMRTWNPERLFPWCLDIVELEEFGISSAQRALGHYSF